MSTSMAGSSWATSKSMLHGLGMWYGARTYTEKQWNDECALAKSWHMTWVHPKFADGGNWWYSHSDMQAMVHIAHLHGLKIAPYHYCYGNKFGALETEAAICATIGQLCDAVCPDIESEWNGQHGWATAASPSLFAPKKRGMGYLVRHVYKSKALIFPTLFPNPASHPTPYAELNDWITGWIPMAYFNVWTSGGHMMTASEAVSYLFPQWQALDQMLVKTKKKHLTPIFPLIGVYRANNGSHPAPGEIANWLKLMYRYGYCGFWYKGEYAPYAHIVEQTVAHPEIAKYLLPPVALPAPAPAPAPAPKPPTPITTLVPAPEPTPAPLQNPLTPLPDVLVPQPPIAPPVEPVPPLPEPAPVVPSVPPAPDPVTPIPESIPAETPESDPTGEAGKSPGEDAAVSDESVPEAPESVSVPLTLFEELIKALSDLNATVKLPVTPVPTSTTTSTTDPMGRGQATSESGAAA